MNEGRRRLLAAASVAAGGWILYALGRPRPAPPAATEYLRNALGPRADDADFARAEERPRFLFPRDHGPHPAFRTEWWYFTGHLATPAARSFGFQLTLFRFELARSTPPSPSAWRTPRVLLAHFAVSDIAGQRFHAFERLSRALPGIAGIASAPPAIWLDDWRIALAPDGARWTLSAGQGGVSLALDLDPRTAVVPQGDGGLSRKSARPGNASYYYSLPRLAARGTLVLPDGAHAVAGSAWLDREWSTSALDRRQIGWDWFALQLDDGASLMFYRLRERDGGDSPYSAGSYVTPGGSVVTLALADVEFEVHDHWLSPASGRRYPASWSLRVPARDLAVRLNPLLASQEWHGLTPYWEGAVAVTDVRDDRPRGRGYVELTGY